MMDPFKTAISEQCSLLRAALDDIKKQFDENELSHLETIHSLQTTSLNQAVEYDKGKPVP